MAECQIAPEALMAAVLQRSERQGDCLVWLAADVDGYADSVHGVIEAVEALTQSE